MVQNEAHGTKSTANNEYCNGTRVFSPYTSNSTVMGGFSTTANKFSAGNNAIDQTTITISKKHNNKSTTGSNK